MDKVKQGRQNRRKGKAFELVVARAFRERWPRFCRYVCRGLQDRDGGEVADVQGVPGLWIECKFGKSVPIRAALAQAAEKCTTGEVPVAVIKDHRQPPFVVLGLDDFLDLLDERSYAEMDKEGL